MDLDEVKEVAEDFFADKDTDRGDLEMTIGRVSTDGETLFIRFIFDADEFEDGELSPRATNAANAAVDSFRAEYPEYEDLAIELDFATAR